MAILDPARLTSHNIIFSPLKRTHIKLYKLTHSAIICATILFSLIISICDASMMNEWYCGTCLALNDGGSFLCAGPPNGSECPTNKPNKLSGYDDRGAWRQCKGRQCPWSSPVTFLHPDQQKHGGCQRCKQIDRRRERSTARSERRSASPTPFNDTDRTNHGASPRTRQSQRGQIDAKPSSPRSIRGRLSRIDLGSKLRTPRDGTGCTSPSQFSTGLNSATRTRNSGQPQRTPLPRASRTASVRPNRFGVVLRSVRNGEANNDPWMRKYGRISNGAFRSRRKPRASRKPALNRVRAPPVTRPATPPRRQQDAKTAKWTPGVHRVSRSIGRLAWKNRRDPWMTHPTNRTRLNLTAADINKAIHDVSTISKPPGLNKSNLAGVRRPDSPRSTDSNGTASSMRSGPQSLQRSGTVSSNASVSTPTSDRNGGGDDGIDDSDGRDEKTHNVDHLALGRRTFLDGEDNASARSSNRSHSQGRSESPPSTNGGSNPESPRYNGTGSPSGLAPIRTPPRRDAGRRPNSLSNRSPLSDYRTTTPSRIGKPGSTRIDTRPNRMSPLNFSPASPVSRFGGDRRKWKCARCTLDNYSSDTKCKVCGAPKPGDRTKLNSATPVGEEPDIEELQWIADYVANNRYKSRHPDHARIYGVPYTKYLEAKEAQNVLRSMPDGVGTIIDFNLNEDQRKVLRVDWLLEWRPRIPDWLREEYRAQNAEA